jgi:hypothetical protein
MARFRLRAAHYLQNVEMKTSVWLPGDTDNEHLGPERGTMVGDGTPYPITDATTEMIPLDAEAEAMIAAEEERLARNGGTMTPVDQLPGTTGGGDDYESRYVPGSNRPRPRSEPPGRSRAPTDSDQAQKEAAR